MALPNFPYNTFFNSSIFPSISDILEVKVSISFVNVVLDDEIILRVSGKDILTKAEPIRYLKFKVRTKRRKKMKE